MDNLQLWTLALRGLEIVWQIMVVAVIPVAVVLVRQIISLRRMGDRHEHRITTLEKAVDCLPGDKAMGDLNVAVTRLAGEAKTMREAVERMEKMVDRHEDFLLHGGARR